jgi:hypothetical protein
MSGSCGRTTMCLLTRVRTHERSLARWAGTLALLVDNSSSTIMRLCIHDIDDCLSLGEGWLYLSLDAFLANVPPDKVFVSSNYRSALTNIFAVRNNEHGRALMFDWMAVAMRCAIILLIVISISLSYRGGGCRQIILILVFSQFWSCVCYLVVKSHATGSTRPLSKCLYSRELAVTPPHPL